MEDLLLRQGIFLSSYLDKATWLGGYGMDEIQIERLVRQILEELAVVERDNPSGREDFTVGNEEYADLREKDLYTWTSVPNPLNEDGFKAAVKSTPSRIGIWRAGPRPKVEHWLRFRADHAAANDSVLREIPENMFEKLGFFEVFSRASSKDEYLTRPDLGRLLSGEAEEAIRQKCTAGAQVQLVLGDGLSSMAIEKNAPEFIPAFEEVIKSYGLNMGQGFLVRRCRVGIMNAIGEVLSPDVVVLLIGERPGLVTAESMSAYMCYKPVGSTIESDRTLVSNIHPGGIPAIEAAAHVAGITKAILDVRASGLKLRDIQDSKRIAQEKR